MTTNDLVALVDLTRADSPHLGRDALRKRIQRGEVEYVRIGRKIFLSRAVLAKLNAPKIIEAKKEKA
jgi:hypothetical protein